MIKNITILIAIILLIFGLIIWLLFLLNRKPKKRQKKSKDQKRTLKQKNPSRTPEEISRQKKLDDFVLTNPKYATELVRSWINQTQKRL